MADGEGDDDGGAAVRRSRSALSAAKRSGVNPVACVMSCQVLPAASNCSIRAIFPRNSPSWRPSWRPFAKPLRQRLAPVTVLTLAALVLTHPLAGVGVATEARRAPVLPTHLGGLRQ